MFCFVNMYTYRYIHFFVKNWSYTFKSAPCIEHGILLFTVVMFVDLINQLFYIYSLKVTKIVISRCINTDRIFWEYLSKTNVTDMHLDEYRVFILFFSNRISFSTVSLQWIPARRVKSSLFDMCLYVFKFCVYEIFNRLVWRSCIITLHVQGKHASFLDSF